MSTASGYGLSYGGYTSNDVVAVPSFGLNSYGRATDFSYRVDTPGRARLDPLGRR